MPIINASDIQKYLTSRDPELLAKLRADIESTTNRYDADQNVRRIDLVINHFRSETKALPVTGTRHRNRGLKFGLFAGSAAALYFDMSPTASAMTILDSALVSGLIGSSVDKQEVRLARTSTPEFQNVLSLKTIANAKLTSLPQVANTANATIPEYKTTLAEELWDFTRTGNLDSFHEAERIVTYAQPYQAKALLTTVAQYNWGDKYWTKAYSDLDPDDKHSACVYGLVGAIAGIAIKMYVGGPGAPAPFFGIPSAMTGAMLGAGISMHIRFNQEKIKPAIAQRLDWLHHRATDVYHLSFDNRSYIEPKRPADESTPESTPELKSQSTELSVQQKQTAFHEEMKKTIADNIVRLDAEIQAIYRFTTEVNEYFKDKPYFGKTHEGKLVSLLLLCTVGPYAVGDNFPAFFGAAITSMLSAMALMFDVTKKQIELKDCPASIQNEAKRIISDKDRQECGLGGIEMYARSEADKKFKSLEENLRLARDYKIQEFENKSASVSYYFDWRNLLTNTTFLKCLGYGAIGVLAVTLIQQYDSSLRDTLKTIITPEGKSCDELFLGPKRGRCQGPKGNELVIDAICQTVCDELAATKMMWVAPMVLTMIAGVMGVTELLMFSFNSKYTPISQFNLFKKDREQPQVSDIAMEQKRAVRKTN